MKQIILEIQKRFELALEAKTGWGKNEIKTIYQQIVIEVFADEIDYNSESFQEIQASKYQAEQAIDGYTADMGTDELPY